MKTAPIKTLVLMITLTALVVALNGCKKKEPATTEPPAQQQATEPQVQQEVKKAEPQKRDLTRAERARLQRSRRRLDSTKNATEPEQDAILGVAMDVQAERIYQWTLTESKIAKKPMMSYKRMVGFCRQLLKEFPETIQAEKARQLLRDMPPAKQQRYKVTAEEMASTR